MSHSPCITQVIHRRRCSTLAWASTEYTCLGELVSQLAALGEGCHGGRHQTRCRLRGRLFHGSAKKHPMYLDQELPWPCPKPSFAGALTSLHGEMAGSVASWPLSPHVGAVRDPGGRYAQPRNTHPSPLGPRRSSGPLAFPRLAAPAPSPEPRTRLNPPAAHEWGCKAGGLASKMVVGSLPTSGQSRGRPQSPTLASLGGGGTGLGGDAGRTHGMGLMLGKPRCFCHEGSPACGCGKACVCPHLRDRYTEVGIVLRCSETADTEDRPLTSACLRELITPSMHPLQDSDAEEPGLYACLLVY